MHLRISLVINLFDGKPINIIEPKKGTFRTVISSWSCYVIFGLIKALFISKDVVMWHRSHEDVAAVF